MEQLNAMNIVFQHLIELPNCECVFCSTVDANTGRSILFLVFNQRKRIYMRNGSKDTWDELKENDQFQFIMDLYNLAVLDQKVPCFTA